MNHDQFWDDLARDLVREFRHYRSHLQSIETSVKPDMTLLTDADVAIQDLVIDRIRQIDPDPVVVAEEDERTALREDVRNHPRRIWIVDPIDGTAEFTKPHGREFCSVVCLLEDFIPVATLVLAPELGNGSTPIVITANAPEASITINGKTATRSARASWVSATRSKGTTVRGFESALTGLGYSLKTRTTSQTLDMARTALDISTFTDLDAPQFRLFIRENQKAWDGLAGMCLGQAAGLRSVDSGGKSHLPVSAEVLSQPEPVFSATVMGDEELVNWLLERI